MKIKQGQIIIRNLQIKSEDKLRKLAKAIEVIEEECGIHEVEIELENIFICPWIDLKNINDSGMEKLLSNIIFRMRNAN